MENKKCPKCKSSHTDRVEMFNTKFLICLNCGYDESEDVLDVYPEGRSTQSGKTGHNPYKRGGGMRTSK